MKTILSLKYLSWNLGSSKKKWNTLKSLLCFLPLELRPLRPVEPQVTREDNRHFASGSLGVSNWSHSRFHPLTPEPRNPGSGRNSTIYWMLIQSMYNHLEKLDPGLQCNWVFKRSFHCFIKPATSGDGGWGADVIRPVSSISLGPDLHLFSWVVSSLIKGGAM